MMKTCQNNNKKNKNKNVKDIMTKQNNKNKS